MPDGFTGYVAFQVLSTRATKVAQRDLKRLITLTPGENRIQIGVSCGTTDTGYLQGARIERDSKGLPYLNDVTIGLENCGLLRQALTADNVQVEGNLRQHSWEPDGPKLFHRVFTGNGPALDFWIVLQPVKQQLIRNESAFAEQSFCRYARLVPSAAIVRV